LEARGKKTNKTYNSESLSQKTLAKKISGKNIPSRKLTHPTKRDKENHLQNAIFVGYLGFLEGKHLLFHGWGFET